MVEKEELLPPEVPKYNGILTITEPVDVFGFDPHIFFKGNVYSARFTCDELLTGDWTKGPAGTGEVDWTAGEANRPDLLTGELAESWEMPDRETLIYHIRKGVHWQDKPPVNGREFTAEDAAFNIRRDYAKGGYRYIANHPLGKEPQSVTALDRWTVEVKVPAEFFNYLAIAIGDYCEMVPPESVALYGDMKNWRNAVGTGPYLLTDYVPGSSLT